MSAKIKHNKTGKVYSVTAKELDEVMSSTFSNQYTIIEKAKKVEKPKEVANKGKETKSNK